MPIVELQDSRRLTGPNLIADRAGAVIDGRVEGVPSPRLLAAWDHRAEQMLDAVGWATEIRATRVYPGGVSVFLSAPIDALYAATEVNEWAWEQAAADVGAGAAPDSLADAAQRLVGSIEDERNPALVALQRASELHGLTFLSDDDHASVGLGAGSRTWTVDALPDPADIRWTELHDIPRVLVTGTNGKTTTVRMLAEIVRVAGRVAGFTCTDGLYVDDELVDGGDWSGPGGARAILRDRRVDVAVLETARGGMLRRGLGVARAQAALVANVAEDHLGEWGVATVEDVASAKLVVARAVEHGAPLVINADDPVLAPAARALGRPITWISVEGGLGGPARTLAQSQETVWGLDDGWITRGVVGRSGGAPAQVVEAAKVPATLGGAAIYNVYNAMGAAALAHALGMGDVVIRNGLESFDPSPEKSPGRSNLFDIAGVKVLVDFVHNPHGFAAVGSLVRALAPARVGLMIGHAGDRDDQAIRDLARAGWALGPDRVAIKELVAYRRGRAAGEVPEVIRQELLTLGAPVGSTTVHGNEVSAARALLEWARSGDLVLLSTHEQRAEVLALVHTLKAAGWAPGDPVPDTPHSPTGSPRPAP